MYSLLKHSKQDSSGVAPLKSDGRTLSDDCEKSNALNRQFQSVFSPKSPERLSSLAHRKLQELNDQGCNLPFQSSPYSQMPENPELPQSSRPIPIQAHSSTDSPCRTCLCTASDLPEVKWSYRSHLTPGSFLIPGKKQMCLPFSKKETSQTLQIIVRYHSHVFCAKCSNTWGSGGGGGSQILLSVKI